MEFNVFFWCLFSDERNGLDALATLADLCFLPSPRRELGLLLYFLYIYIFSIFNMLPISYCLKAAAPEGYWKLTRKSFFIM